MADKFDTEKVISQEEARRVTVIELARSDYRVSEGELEIEDDAVVSFGDDNSAYVQTWLWVDFAGTQLDQSAKKESPQD